METLGSTTVICTDKTGTLTRNKMTVTVLETERGRVNVQGVGYAPVGTLTDEDGQPIQLPLKSPLTDLLRGGLLCNNAMLTQRDDQWMIEGDPTEGALLVVAQKASLHLESEKRDCPRVSEIPFSSDQQYMATSHRSSSRGGMIVAKGSPEKILTLCDYAGTDQGYLNRNVWTQKALALASEGLRVLAVAMKPKALMTTCSCRTTEWSHPSFPNFAVVPPAPA